MERQARTNLGTTDDTYRLKVMVVGPSTEFLSGITRYTYHLTNALAERLSVSAALYRKLLPAALFPGRRRIGRKLADLTISSQAVVFDEIDYSAPKSWNRFRRFFSQVRPDVVCVVWWTAATCHTTLMLQEWARSVGCSTVGDVHEIGDPSEQTIPVLGKLSRRVSRIVLEGFDHLIVHSPEAREGITNLLPSVQPRCSYIKHPTSVWPATGRGYQASRETWRFKGKKVVLLPGLIRKYKGYETLLASIRDPRIWSRNDTLFVIAGENWENPVEFHRQTEPLLEASRLLIIDRYLSDEEYRSLLVASDVIVAPYVRVSQSGVIADAIALGKVLITSELPGMVEQVSHYEGARFFRPGDAGELATVLNDVLDGLRSDLTGSLTSSETRTWQAAAGQYIDVFRRVCAK